MLEATTEKTIKQEIINRGFKVNADENFEIVKIYDDIYENYYVSNYGRVWSVNVNRFIYSRIDNHGYVKFKLHKNGKIKYIAGQRLVAFAFVKNPNPDKYNVVNHKDEKPTNNFWLNLEWCDDKYNLNHATAQQRRAAKRAKQVIQYDLEGNLVNSFASLPEITRMYGYFGSVICNHIKTGKAYEGYYWRHAS